MSPDDIDDRQEPLEGDERLAEELVDQALRGMQIPESLRPAIRASMIGELLATPEGRRQLRRVAPDPSVASSGDVAKPGARGAGGAAGNAAKNGTKDKSAAGAKRGRRGGGRP